MPKFKNLNETFREIFEQCAITQGKSTKFFSPFVANSLVAIYAGQLLPSEKEVLFPNMTEEEQEDVHKNWLYYDDTYLIDVPPSLTDFVKYRASLGHKVTYIFFMGFS